jgi:hypothetical protein
VLLTTLRYRVQRFLSRFGPENVIRKIPGEIFGSAGYALPAANPTGPDTQRVRVSLSNSTRAEVTFVKIDIVADRICAPLTEGKQPRSNG